MPKYLLNKWFSLKIKENFADLISSKLIKKTLIFNSNSSNFTLKQISKCINFHLKKIFKKCRIAMYKIKNFQCKIIKEMRNIIKIINFKTQIT